MNEDLFSSALVNRLPMLWKVAGLVWRGLTNLTTLRRILRFLNLPTFIDLVQDNPKFAFKCLTDAYLMKGLSIPDRADCFLHNHELLLQRVPTSVLRQILTWGIDVAEFTEEGIRFTVRCGLSRPCGKEGEQSLILLADGEILYTLTFTVVPGRIIGSKSVESILISRMQGEADLPSRKLKAAQIALSRLRFGSVLLSCLEGFSLALGIEEITCVSSSLQLSYAPAHASRFKHAYEDLLVERGFGLNERGIYVSPVPIRERTPEENKAHHPNRARARHALRQKLSASCREAVSDLLKPSTNLPIESSNEVPVRPERSLRLAQEEAALARDTSTLSFG
jgi:uncharacterized protein VirK/YbjX